MKIQVRAIEVNHLQRKLVRFLLFSRGRGRLYLFKNLKLPRFHPHSLANRFRSDDYGLQVPFAVRFEHFHRCRCLPPIIVIGIAIIVSSALPLKEQFAVN